MSFIRKLVDERFLSHRRRSTSIAGTIGGALAIGLFAYRYFIDHVWSWDLLAGGLTIVGVKVAVMTWSLLNDISFVIGSLLVLWLSKSKPRIHEQYTLPVASGIIAGESLMAVGIAFLVIFKLLGG